MKSLLMTLAIILAGPGAALAHSDTEATTPADGATVEAVKAIEMRFDDPMRVTRVVLTGPDGEVELELERETGLEPVTLLRAVPTVELAPGDFSVEWRGLSSDGHPMQGSFEFSVAD